MDELAEIEVAANPATRRKETAMAAKGNTLQVIRDHRYTLPVVTPVTSSKIVR